VVSSKTKQPIANVTAKPGVKEMLERSIRREARELLREERGVETLVFLVEETAKGAQMVADETREKLNVQTACAEGCVYCCYLQVSVTAPEVMRLAAHIRQNFTAEEQAALKERLAQLDTETRGMSAMERAQATLPCALLVENRCSAYAARPYMCMGCNSMDVNPCREFFEGDYRVTAPSFQPQDDAARGVQAGLMGGLSDSGYRPELLELTAALRIALEIPDAGERWAAGEPVFAPARMGTVRNGLLQESPTWKRGV
jgi:hypothetical protein